MLGRHATSNERLPLLDQGYYERLFAVTGVPTSIVDLAAALHPFELRWMGLPPNASYRAYDNNEEFVDAAGAYLRAEGVGDAEQRDVELDPPTDRADLAFLLMTYHCMEQFRQGAGWRALRSMGLVVCSQAATLAGAGFERLSPASKLAEVRTR